ncbi:hypothetical protein PSTT_03097 [Puccinia striiformis]|uniref:DDE Tnp4 domain-containing protein n=1 Tax=Puccinia striiformis TaxID=27350 RepID=A0A2S4VXI2_9BASI|nr:hypothetical protein PSTT_03097 [Puccinia striiformis]
MIILEAALSHCYYAPRIALQQAPPITEFLLVRLEDRRSKQEFRMTRASFLKLCARVADDPVFQNNSNNPQRPITEQMMVTLKRLGCFGNGASVGMLARFFRVGEGTVELYTDRCIMAILRFKNQVLKWPTAIERGKMAEEYGEVGFKGCVGVIDGSLIPLSDSPSLNIHLYWVAGLYSRLSGDVKFKHNSEARLVLFTWAIYTRRLSVHTNLECGASIQEASSWTVDQRTTYFQFLSCSASGGDRAMHWWPQGKISKPKRPAPPDQRAQGSNSCESWIMACAVLHNFLNNGDDFDFDDLGDDNSVDIAGNNSSDDPEDGPTERASVAGRELREKIKAQVLEFYD